MSDVIRFSNSRGKGLVAELIHPADEGGEIVLIAPGLTRGRESSTAALVADGLSRIGVGSVRISMEGCGDAEGDLVDFTISRASQDVSDLVGLLLHSGHRRLSGVGISSGGSVMLAALRQRAPLQSLALLAPVLDYPAKRLRELGTDGIRKWEVEGVMDWRDGEGNVHRFGYSFLKDSAKWVMRDRAEDFNTPMLILHGTADLNTDPKESQAFCEAAPSIAQLRLVPGANHSFFVDGEQCAIGDMVAEWFLLPIEERWPRGLSS